MNQAFTIWIECRHIVHEALGLAVQTKVVGLISTVGRRIFQPP